MAGKMAPTVTVANVASEHWPFGTISSTCLITQHTNLMEVNISYI